MKRENFVDADQIIKSVLAHLESKYTAEYQMLNDKKIYIVKRDGAEIGRFTLSGKYPGFKIEGEGDLLKRNYEEFAPIRQEIAYQLKLESDYAASISATQDATPTKPDTGKRGKRSRYTIDERDDAVKAWEKTDKDADSQKLADFLTERFGDDESTFKSNVADATFYTWRDDFYKRNPEWTPQQDATKRRKEKNKIENGRER